MTDNKLEETMYFKSQKMESMSPREVLDLVHTALVEKGYNPTNQLVGYLISGDPAYITSHRQARSIIRRAERYDLLEVLVNDYFAGDNGNDDAK